MQPKQYVNFIVPPWQAKKDQSSIPKWSGEPISVASSFYCTNPSCSTPIHTLLADTVEVCGGSWKLIHILNQLGAVCSEDVHDRFVTRQAQIQQSRHVWDELPPHIFTLATVDNFDKLKSCCCILRGPAKELPWNNNAGCSAEPKYTHPKCSSNRFTPSFPNAGWYFCQVP